MLSRCREEITTCLAYIHCLTYTPFYGALAMIFFLFVFVITMGWEAKRNPKPEEKVKGSLFYILTINYILHFWKLVFLADKGR